jgi:hypothetical protein
LTPTLSRKYWLLLPTMLPGR